MSNIKFKIANPDFESDEVYSATNPEKAAKKIWRKHKCMSVIMVVEDGQTSPVFTYFPRNWTMNLKKGKRQFKDNKRSHDHCQSSDDDFR